MNEKIDRLPIVLSSVNGVNATSPLCFFCGKPKNEVHLLGSAGDDLIKLLGRKVEDGLPQAVWFSDDYVPCADCYSKYIGIIVTDNRRQIHKRVYQMDRQTLNDDPKIHPHIKYWASLTGVLHIPEFYAERLGLLKVTKKASERTDDA
jgi:hypothetical protein